MNAPEEIEGALEQKVNMNVPPCPACFKPMHERPMMNARSRYAIHNGERIICICSDCGRREALEGNFWLLDFGCIEAIARLQKLWRTTKWPP